MLCWFGWEGIHSIDTVYSNDARRTIRFWWPECWTSKKLKVKKGKKLKKPKKSGFRTPFLRRPLILKAFFWLFWVFLPKKGPVLEDETDSMRIIYSLIQISVEFLPMLFFLVSVMPRVGIHFATIFSSSDHHPSRDPFSGPREGGSAGSTGSKTKIFEIS